jgi:solute carrier family 25 S-adenosylmethionine transporter 26
MSDIFVQSSSGALAGITADMVFYGLDSYKVMKQAGEKFQMRRLFRGMVPVAILGSGPSFALFFGVYSFAKDKLERSTGDSKTSVLIASILGGIPSSLVAVPADLLKKRIVLETTERSWLAVSREIINKEGAKGMFLGWQANMLKDLPFAAIKMTLYEGCKSLYLTFRAKYWRQTSGVDSTNDTNLSLPEYGVVGFASGAATAVLTTPLDCVNTRIKSGELREFGVIRGHFEIIKRDGWKALFRGLGPRTIIISLGSSVFWSMQNAIIKVIS